MIGAVLFDFDYTLGDSTMGIVQSVNYALGKLGYDAKPVPAIQKTIGLPLIDTFLELEKNGTKKEAEEFSVLFKKKADEVMVPNTILYEGIKDTLYRFKSDGYKIGIVTTKYSYRIESIFSKYDALDLLDVIVGGDNVREEKPSPEGLLFAIHQLGLDKSEVLYVGDSVVDAKAADNAKVDFAAVLTGTTTKEEFILYPHVIIGDSVMNIYDVIQSL